MRVDELAEELADFWYTAVAEAGWERRLHLLNEIHAQLRSDLETNAEYEAVSPRFVAALIDRLGAPPVDNEAQATVYRSSLDALHQEAGRLWSQQTQSDSGSTAEGLAREDRRSFPRRRMDALSEIWLQGRAAPCRLVDLSEGGARLVVREPALSPGTPLRVAVPESGIRDARVVFRNTEGIGVQFVDQPAAA